MRYIIFVLWMLFWSVPSAMAQLSIGIGLPGVSIGINLPLYPELVPVPGYPVYYAPRLNSNYFFYDGMYWVYQEDNWYASSWYNGPWGLVGPEAVPLFVLRIPVRYYRQPPMYFRGWQSDAPPRWGEHWGNQWDHNRSGWDRWDRNSAPAPAPLPVYQRQYSGDRYPRGEQQQALHNQNYRYQPREAVVRQHYQEQQVHQAPAPSPREKQGASQERSSRPQDTQRTNAPPPPQGGTVAPRSPPPQKAIEGAPKPAPTQAPPQPRAPAAQDPARQPQQGAVQREPQAPRSGQQSVPQAKGAPPASERGQGKEKDRGKDDEPARERGQERGQDRTR